MNRLNGDEADLAARRLLRAVFRLKNVAGAPCQSAMVVPDPYLEGRGR